MSGGLPNRIPGLANRASAFALDLGNRQDVQSLALHVSNPPDARNAGGLRLLATGEASAA
jgi:hypothetical protein